MKTCTKCKMTKLYASFYKWDRSKDGYHPWCKQCSSEANAKHRAIHRGTLLEKRREMWLKTKHADNEKRKQRYASNALLAEQLRQKQKTWRKNNRDAHRAYSRKWVEEHREYALKRKREYYKANRDAMQVVIRRWKKENPEALRDYFHNREASKRTAGGKHTRAQIAELLDKQHGLCAVCSADIREKRHRDHKVPVSTGGSNDISNIQLLCPDCNLGKRAKDMETFLLERQI